MRLGNPFVDIEAQHSGQGANNHHYSGISTGESEPCSSDLKFIDPRVTGGLSQDDEDPLNFYRRTVLPPPSPAASHSEKRPTHPFFAHVARRMQLARDSTSRSPVHDPDEYVLGSFVVPDTSSE